MEIGRKKLCDMKNATDGEVSANHADETVELDSEDNDDEHIAQNAATHPGLLRPFSREHLKAH